MLWFAARAGAKVIMGNSKLPYIALNVIRALNILSICACILASGSLLVKTADLTGKIGWYNYFDLGEKCLIIVFAMLVLLTEIPRVMRGYIARNWPHFGYDAGFCVLSSVFVFLGFDTLSFLAKEGTDSKHLGADFFRMVQAAGFIALVMSVLNLVASFVFKDRRRGLTARQVRAYKNIGFQQEAV